MFSFNCKSLLDENNINEALYDKIKPSGSQAPRIYGLAKVHKQNIPVRPVLSMPGSAYHKIANQVADWLKVVKECNINSSAKDISNTLKDVILDPDEELVSFDVTSLYTNVPVQEAITDCTEMLYSGNYPKPPISKETFIELLKLCTCNVLMLTHDGYYRQKDGLAMGSPPAPLLANGWLSKYDERIKDSAKMYERYMDDILREIKVTKIDQKLGEINSYHPSLKFTIEREHQKSLPFLDMRIIRENCSLNSTWYTKTTDTGLTMNFHAVAPLQYKKSVVTGFIHRIYNSCSTWKNFHESVTKAKAILENNQYPPHFYEPLVKKAIDKLIEKEKTDVVQKVQDTDEEKEEKKVMKIEYRGKVTEKFESSLKRINVPCVIVKTIRKLKTSMPSLKAQVDSSLQSKVVYKIACPRCDACYVGQTVRHLTTRMKEHKRNGPVASHFNGCHAEFSMECVSILAKTNRSVYHLMTLEALLIRDIKPTINTKDEYRSRKLTIKL